jgi:hypothetical protein
MKKRIKERVLIGKWINGLNQMMRASNDTAAVENGLTDMMRGGMIRGGTNNSAAASMIGAGNDTAAVENDGYPRPMIHCRTRQLISCRILVQPILLGGDQTILRQLARYHVL